MARLKERPDLDNIGINPFSAELKIRVNRKYKEVLNKFGDADKLESVFESVGHTKVFDQVGAKALVCSLSIRAKELYLHVMYSLVSGQDIIWIHRDRYMELYGIKSVNTYKDAVRDLSDKLLIYPHASLKDVYWINPHYFFKGNRQSKYPNNLVINKNENK
jgi:hypothetical protein